MLKVITAIAVCAQAGQVIRDFSDEGATSKEA